MNLLDPDIFPYDRVNGSTLPPPDPGMKAETPSVSSPGYGSDIVDFVRSNAPDTFDGQNVGFGRAFFGLIPGPPLIDLEVWGAPISTPPPDPTNAHFVYQLFPPALIPFHAT